MKVEVVVKPEGRDVPPPETVLSAIRSLPLILADRIDVRRRLAAVKDVRRVGKADLPNNDAMPRIEVEPDTFTVRIDGEVWQEQPAAELPMAQRYFLF